MEPPQATELPDPATPKADSLKAKGSLFFIVILVVILPCSVAGQKGVKKETSKFTYDGPARWVSGWRCR